MASTGRPRGDGPQWGNTHGGIAAYVDVLVPRHSRRSTAPRHLCVLEIRRAQAYAEFVSEVPCDGRRYPSGCRCPLCRTANAKKHREFRAARKAKILSDPTVAKHGLRSTYVNWGCRCQKCTDAHKASCRLEHRSRTTRAAVGAPGVPHGTANGYNWGCRCDDCHTAAHEYWVNQNGAQRLRWRAINDLSRDTASHHYDTWTGPELEYLSRPDVTARLASERLGRTMSACRNMRAKLKLDPRKHVLAGVETADAPVIGR